MLRTRERFPTPIPTPISTLVLILVLVLAVLLAPSPGLAAPPAEPPAAPPLLRKAPPPSALEQARMERWYDAWRAEGAAVVRSFRAAAEAARPGSGTPLRPRCVALAGALVTMDRDHVLPVPDRAADRHLRGALRHLARAAVACLTDRPYAAVGALRRADDALRQAGSVLRRYGVPLGAGSRR